ncbi:MAG: zinc-ribbon domain-containing protein [Clostridia bacterium]|nr:zinc-ribbon domain-containing protein [Clostridia bacterium]
MNLKDFCIKEGKEYLLQEWDDEKNLPFSPDIVSSSSSVPVWWKCEKGHSWQTQLRSRAKSLTRCPKCLATELSKKRKQQAMEYAKRLKPE